VELPGCGYSPTWVQEVDALTIFVADINPLLGASGSTGAIAMNGPKYPPVLHWIGNGCVVRVYCAGGRSMAQKTGSGVTVIGAAEKVPVATSETCPPSILALMVMD